MYNVEYRNKGETRHFFNVKCRKEISGKAKLMLGILLAFILSVGGSPLTTAEKLRNVTAAQYGEVQGTDEGGWRTAGKQCGNEDSWRTAGKQCGDKDSR